MRGLQMNAAAAGLRLGHLHDRDTFFSLAKVLETYRRAAEYAGGILSLEGDWFEVCVQVKDSNGFRHWERSGFVKPVIDSAGSVHWLVETLPPDRRQMFAYEVGEAVAMLQKAMQLTSGSRPRSGGNSEKE